MINKKYTYSAFIIIWMILCISAKAQHIITSTITPDSITITTDYPVHFNKAQPTIIILYALPNGNTTLQTMGKKMNDGDDWHFNIQHIKAQTAFIRKQLNKQNIVVIYLENNLKSWPAWKAKNPDYKTRIPHLVDSLYSMVDANNKQLYLNGHSGGGSFIFGYLAGVSSIPEHIKRISFLDSDYGYDSSYDARLIHWLNNTKNAHLNIFAYNDSIALYNGKPVVSATGGTWYRSRLMLNNLSTTFAFKQTNLDSLIIYKSTGNKIHFYLKTNPDRLILHTVQVERNGFIHSILINTKKENKGYQYYGPRAYDALIE